MDRKQKEQIFDQICLLEALGRSGSPKIKYITFFPFWGDYFNLPGSGSEFFIWDPLTLLDPKHCLAEFN
jgi:hypothetical protein